MIIKIVRAKNSVKSTSTDYCCGQMCNALETDTFRYPMPSAKVPKVLLGRLEINYCPFCGQKISITVEEQIDIRI